MADEISTVLTECNSNLRLVPQGPSLDDPGMPKSRALAELKAVRRQRLRVLWDSMGGSVLAEITGIDKAYLYQMALGEGRNARGISDETAALIESKAGKPEGWISAREAQVAEDPAIYDMGDRILLRNAIVQVESRLVGLSKNAAELRADIIFSVYDMLRAGRSEETVSGFLSGIQFAPPNRTSKV